jgi:adenylate kinase
VILFGPPGAGKGTQAALLEKSGGFVHVSTGAVLRRQIEQGTSLGLSIRALMDRGELVSDELILDSLREFLLGKSETSLNEKQVLLLDGVPRTVRQISMLSGMLGELGFEMSGVVSFEASVEGLKKRFSDRLVCVQCSATVSALAGFTDGSDCPVCKTSHSLSRRKDDAPETVQRRFELYESQTKPVLEKLSKMVQIVRIDALLDQDSAFERISEAMKIFGVGLADI